MTFQSWKKPLAGGLVVAAGLFGLSSGNAQEAEQPADVLYLHQEVGPPNPERQPLGAMTLKAAADQAPRRTVRSVLALVGPDKGREIREAAAAVNAAEDDEAKDRAKEKLEQLLDDYFDEDMKRREQELEQIEERVKKLQAQLDRRREKRREIVDLQLQVLLNEADGLGFFSGDQLFMGPGGGNPFEFKVEPFAAPAAVPHPGPPGAVIYAPQPPQAPAPARVSVEARRVGPRERSREREREADRERNRERDREDNDIFGDEEPNRRP
jgi:hypothetical protein